METEKRYAMELCEHAKEKPKKGESYICGSSIRKGYDGLVGIANKEQMFHCR